jgi:hypothetical protein
VTWARVPWVVTAAFFVMLVGSSFLGQRYRRQRDLARAELATARVELEAAAISIKEAVAAAERNGAEVLEQRKRTAAVIEELAGRGDRYRRALRKCKSAEATAQRLGELFL